MISVVVAYATLVLCDLMKTQLCVVAVCKTFVYNIRGNFVLLSYSKGKWYQNCSVTVILPMNF